MNVSRRFRHPARIQAVAVSKDGSHHHVKQALLRDSQAVPFPTTIALHSAAVCARLRRTPLRDETPRGVPPRDTPRPEDRRAETASPPSAVTG